MPTPDMIGEEETNSPRLGQDRVGNGAKRLATGQSLDSLEDMGYSVRFGPSQKLQPNQQLHPRRLLVCAQQTDDWTSGQSPRAKAMQHGRSSWQHDYCLSSATRAGGFPASKAGLLLPLWTVMDEQGKDGVEKTGRMLTSVF